MSGCVKVLDFAAPAGGAHLSFYWTMDELGAANKVDSTVGLVWPLLAGTLGVPTLFSNGTEIAARIRGLSLTNSPSLVISQAVSQGISFWFWVKVVSYGSNPFFCGLITSGAGFNDFQMTITSPGGATSTVELFHQNNVNISDVTSPNLSWTLGSWHMLAGTYDKVAQLITIYVDGVQSINLADPLVYPDLTTSIWALNTGNPGIGTMPDVICDELGLCLNGALTAAQVLALWNGGAGFTWPAIKTIVPYP